MNAMTQVTAREIQWFAVRMKPNASGGPRTTIVDVQKEQYINRAGQKAWRKVKGTGTRVFLPEHLLKRAGFEVFLPVKQVLRIKNRFTKEKYLVAVPLLADWMFVGLPIVEGEYGRGVLGWKTLMELDVVAGVMGTGGRPIQMSEATVMRLMRQYGGVRAASRVRRRIAERKVCKIGEVTQVIDGPLVGQDVRIVDVAGQTVKALLKILGSEVEVELSTNILS
ncbi:MAG: transcription termination/antitermination NusG family protein [Paracoccaceae bacterium]